MPNPAALLSSSLCPAADGGGFGVAVLDPQGDRDRAFIPADKKPGFVSGVDMLCDVAIALSTVCATPPAGLSGNRS